MRPGDRKPNQQLIRLRLQLGKSQEQYADLVGATARQVRNGESGRVTCPQSWHLLRMHRLHGTAEPDELGFAPRSRRRRVDTVVRNDRTEADVFRRDFLSWVAVAAFGSRPLASLTAMVDSDRTPSAIGPTDVERVHRTNETLFSADFLIGGAAFRPDVLLNQFRRNAAGLEGRYRHDTTRAAMHSAVGHLGSTVGFMLFDQGRQTEARDVYAASLRIAQDADDCWPLRAIIFSEMARQ